MSKNNIVKDVKKLVTDIYADKSREESLIAYQNALASGFTSYAASRLSMNLFTMQEMVEEEMNEAQKAEVEGYVKGINEALQKAFVEDASQEDIAAAKDSLMDIRDRVTNKMKVLTSYTDGFEIYEYILNRREAYIKGYDTEEPDVDELADDMFNFVFSENDKVVINTRIQQFVAQLPVRMTKQRFYDILSNSFKIYKNGEKQSLIDFVEAIKEAALLEKPEGFDEYYPELADILSEMKSADYKKLSPDDYDYLANELKHGSMVIARTTGDFTLLTEVLNDALILALTAGFVDTQYFDENFDSAKAIIDQMTRPDFSFDHVEDILSHFEGLEGVQEEAFDLLTQIEGSLEDLQRDYYDAFENKEIMAHFDALLKADKLTSSSLFMDLDSNSVTIVTDEADDLFIDDISRETMNAFSDYFSEVTQLEQRSVMAKVMSMMPVFFNTQDEIKEYFEVTLNSCSNVSELIACDNIIRDIISQG